MKEVWTQIKNSPKHGTWDAIGVASFLYASIEIAALIFHSRIAIISDWLTQKTAATPDTIQTLMVVVSILLALIAAFYTFIAADTVRGVTNSNLYNLIWITMALTLEINCAAGLACLTFWIAIFLGYAFMVSSKTDGAHSRSSKFGNTFLGTVAYLVLYPIRSMGNMFAAIGNAGERQESKGKHRKEASSDE